MTCGCRVGASNAFDTQRALAGSPPDHLEMIARPAYRIAYCPLHAAAERLAQFLDRLRGGWDCDTGANSAHPDYCRTCEAAALLREIGR